MPNYSHDSRKEDQFEAEVSQMMEDFPRIDRDEAELLVKGWWQDPAGGWHSPDCDDPAKKYE